jgi:prolyl-tRNA synthetase
MIWTKVKALIPTLKEDPADAEIVSHKLMIRAGLIRQLSAGLYIYLPLCLKVIRKIEQIIREEMEEKGAQELLMPMLQPREIWEKSGRWDEMGKEMVRIKNRQDKDFVLGPTHEEVITELVSKEIKSYKDLPCNYYQIQAKVRDEIRPRFGVIRAKEFIMKDSYSFHATDDCLDETFNDMYEAYENIFKRCGIDTQAVEADSGVMGGKASIEFMAKADSGEDQIVSCPECEYSANLEVVEAIEKNEICPSCAKGKLEIKHGIELGHIFKLGRRYTEAMKAGYLDSDGKEKILTMGCYGIGVSRMISAIIEQNYDENGIIWPSSVAPMDIYLIPVNTEDEAVMKESFELYNNLKENGFSVLLDDRTERPGFKFKDADLIGLPIRLVISSKNLQENMLEVKIRKTGEVVKIKKEEIINYCKDLFKTV